MRRIGEDAKRYLDRPAYFLRFSSPSTSPQFGPAGSSLPYVIAGGTFRGSTWRLQQRTPEYPGPECLCHAVPRLVRSDTHLTLSRQTQMGASKHLRPQVHRQATSILLGNSIDSFALAHPLSGCRIRNVCGMEWHIRHWLRVRTLQTLEPRIPCSQAVGLVARHFSERREGPVGARCWHGECFFSPHAAARSTCAAVKSFHGAGNAGASAWSNSHRCASSLSVLCATARGTGRESADQRARKTGSGSRRQRASSQPCAAPCVVHAQVSEERPWDSFATLR